MPLGQMAIYGFAHTFFTAKRLLEEHINYALLPKNTKADGFAVSFRFAKSGPFDDPVLCDFYFEYFEIRRWCGRPQPVSL